MIILSEFIENEYELLLFLLFYFNVKKFFEDIKDFCLWGPIKKNTNVIVNRESLTSETEYYKLWISVSVTIRCARQDSIDGTLYGLFYKCIRVHVEFTSLVDLLLFRTNTNLIDFNKRKVPTQICYSLVRWFVS